MCIKGSALTVTCMLAIFKAAAAYAEASSTADDAIAAQKRADRQRAEGAKSELSAPARGEQHPGRKISTYNLLGNPSIKHGISVSGKTGFGPGRNGVPLGARYKTEPGNSANGSSDCRELAPNNDPRQQEMTACYVHQLDKSWKTQTYVSRRSQAGITNWGGGLAIGYDY